LGPQGDDNGLGDADEVADGGACSAAIWMRKVHCFAWNAPGTCAIASSHLLSRPLFIGGVWDEAGQHGET
jgi:hypothetical protein